MKLKTINTLKDGIITTLLTLVFTNLPCIIIFYSYLPTMGLVVLATTNVMIFVIMIAVHILLTYLGKYAK